MMSPWIWAALWFVSLGLAAGLGAWAMRETLRYLAEHGERLPWERHP